ncbi:MAG: HAD family hydrolase, partial [Vicinamibacterales bacterium]
HGLMKPHPSIFKAALDRLDATPAEAVMVGDSIAHDVEGALRTGMRAVLVHRSAEPHPLETSLTASGVPVVRSLRELDRLLH